MKRYCPTGRRNHGRPLMTLLDTWDRNGSTSGPNAWQIYDDDDDDDVISRLESRFRLPLYQENSQHTNKKLQYISRDQIPTLPIE
jgi:hypothetical protein